MRKSLAIVLCISMVFVLLLTACGNPTGKSESTVTQQQTTAAPTETTKIEAKDVTIKFWVYPMIQGLNGDGTGEFDDWAKDRANRFKENNPTVSFEIELLNWQGGTEKIDVAVASGSAPDLAYSINNFGGVTKFGKMGALEAIDPFLTDEDWSDFSEAVNGGIKYDGKAYMFPWLKLVSAIAVNMDIFKERKAENLLPLSRELRDWTFDEFLAAAKAVTFSRKGGNKPDVFGYPAWGKDGVFYNFLFSPMNGGNILDASFKNYAFNSKESLEGLQFLVDLVNVHKVTPEGSAGMSLQNVRDLFLQQKLAMFPSTSDIVVDVQKASKPFNVEWVAFPHGPNAPTTSWNNVGGFLVFKQNDEYKKQMVMEFGKFATNAENSKILKFIGVFPARASAGNLYEGDNVMSYFSKLADYGNSPYSRSFGLVSVADWEAEIQAMLLKAKTPQQMADDIGKKVNESLSK